MADLPQGLMPSILDRLIDPDSAGTDARRGYGLTQMLEVIRRDLEDLLNTRQSIADIRCASRSACETQPEARHSAKPR